MSVVIVSARVHADNADAVAREARKTALAIAAERWDAGFALYQLADGVTFVAILDLPGDENPMTASPAFVELRKSLTAWGPALPTSVIGEVVARPRQDSNLGPAD